MADSVKAGGTDQAGTAVAIPSASGAPLIRIKWSQVAVLVVVVAVLLAFNFLTNGIFLGQRNLSILLRQAALLGIVTSGMVMLMVGRQIDLSVGSAVYLTGVIAATLETKYNVNWSVALLAGVVVGLLLGLWQGGLVAWLRIPAFVVTLAGMLIFRGIGYVATNAATVGPISPGFKQISDGFIPIAISELLIAIVAALGVAWLVLEHRRLGQWGGDRQSLITRIVVVVGIAAIFGIIVGGFQGINIAVLIMIVVVAAMTFVMNRTKFGRNLYVIGGNPDAARLAGLSINRQILYAFVVMGLLYGVGGDLITSRLGNSTPSTGQFLELDAIAAAVIGGTSLLGGLGTVPGALIGALILSGIDNAMSLMDVSSFLQMAVKGLILLAAVWFDIAVRKR